MIHQLKILPKYFKDVVFGTKTFEVRRNDRNFAVGDLLNLHEFDLGYYTGRKVVCEVTYMLTDKDYVKEGFCILGIKVIEIV